MSLPGFYAANSLYRTTNSYRGVFFSDLPTTRISPAVTCGKESDLEWCKLTADLRYSDCLLFCGIATVTGGHVGVACDALCDIIKEWHHKQCEDSGGCPEGMCCGGRCCTLGTCCRGRCQPPCPGQQILDPITCECKYPCPPGTQTCPSGGPICFQIPECPGGKIWTKDCLCACPPEFFECGGNCVHETARLCPPGMHFSGSKCTCIYSDNCNCGTL